MIGYKAFNNDFTCRGFQYEIGKEYEMDGEIKLCERGFHFCENIADCFKYYSLVDSRFAKIEAYGEVIKMNGGSKCVTNKIRIMEEISREEAIRMSNSGNLNSGTLNSGSYNSGDCNSGNHNSGYYNSGNRNSGDWNSGNRNSGNRNSENYNSGSLNSGSYNSGSWNSGNYNSGYYNSGNRNSGERNSGDWNSGKFNSGDRNSGDWNSGKFNSGDWNSGDWNSGDWNRSSRNNGCFMTVRPMIMLFNKPTDWTIEDWLSSEARDIMKRCPTEYTDTMWVYAADMTDEEKMAHPEYVITRGYLKKVLHKANRQAWWDSLDEDKKRIVMALPNFNADVFYECTGIRV